MPSRRAVLGAVTASLSSVAVAGCVGDAPVDQPDGTATSSNSENCEAVGTYWIDPVRDSIEPRDLPDGPPEWQADSVESFVADYERAFFYNSLLERKTEQLTVSVESRGRAAVAEGFVVRLEATGSHRLRGTPGESGTATAVFGDMAVYLTNYLITRDRLVRAQGDGTPDSDPDPRSEGETVECWG